MQIGHRSPIFENFTYNRIAGAVGLVSTEEDAQPQDDSFSVFDKQLSKAYPDQQKNGAAPGVVGANSGAKKSAQGTTSQIPDLVLPGLTMGHWCVRIGNLLFESMADMHISQGTLARRIHERRAEDDGNPPPIEEIELAIKMQLDGFECAEEFFPDFALEFDFVLDAREIIDEVKERLELTGPAYENLIGLFASAKNVYASGPHQSGDAAQDLEFSGMLERAEQILQNHDSTD